MPEKKLYPVKDPNSTKYPDRTWFGGQWMTQEQIDRGRDRQREWKRERRANDPEYRERHHEWMRERRANDAEYRERERQRNRNRVFAGRTYLGSLEPEQAAAMNAYVKQRLEGFHQTWRAA